DQSGLALLDDLGRVARLSPTFEPGVAGAKRRVGREGQLEHRGEDPYPVVGLRSRWRQHEGRLGEVGPARKPLHLRIRHPLGVEDDRDGVAGIWPAAEDVYLGEAATHQGT